MLGFSERLAATGTVLGADPWLFDGTTTQMIDGLTGAAYASNTGIRRTSVTTIDAAGRMAGTTERFTGAGASRGADAWFNDGTDLRQINLTGVGYEYGSGPAFRSGAPHALSQISRNGHVFGYSDRWSSTGNGLGQDAWVFDGTTTRMVGLTGGVYEFNSAAGLRRFSWAGGFNSAGQAIGYSSRYYGPSFTDSLGFDSWFYDGATTRRINPIGPGYEYTTPNGVYRQSDTGRINAAGQAIGYSTRYTSDGISLGTAGWFFDDATGVTTPLLFSLNADDRSGTAPKYLTDEGVVLGSYDLWNGADFGGTRIFWWSLDAGFYDLGGLAGADLPDDQWERLESIVTVNGTLAGGAPRFIVATGMTPGQIGGNTVFLLTGQVPEPGGALGAALAGAMLLARKRRR